MYHLKRGKLVRLKIYFRGSPMPKEPENPCNVLVQNSRVKPMGKKLVFSAAVVPLCDVCMGREALPQLRIACFPHECIHTHGYRRVPFGTDSHRRSLGLLRSIKKLPEAQKPIKAGQNNSYASVYVRCRAKHPHMNLLHSQQ